MSKLDHQLELSQPLNSRNVISIFTGSRIDQIPFYRDCHAQQESVRLNMDDGDRVVQGHRAVFGLVIHRNPDQTASDLWTLTEPVTGCRVVGGKTRREALDNLAIRVALYGGPRSFEHSLDDARMRSFGIACNNP